MAVILVNERFDRNGNIAQDWSTSYTRRFYVQTDTKTDGPMAVIAALKSAYGIYPGAIYKNATTTTWAPGTATISAYSESDDGAFVRSIEPKCTDMDGKGWTVDVQYGPFDAQSQANENPLEARTEHKWSFAEDEVPVDQDANGNFIGNTAGDPFDPPMMTTESRLILQISRNEPVFFAATALYYKGKVNADMFYESPPGTVRIANITGEDFWNSSLAAVVWRVTYEFHFRPQGWRKYILNAGYNQLVSGVRKPIEVNHHLVSHPMPLDQAGKLLTVGTTPVWLNFDLAAWVPFSDLQLEPLV